MLACVIEMLYVAVSSRLVEECFRNVRCWSGSKHWGALRENWEGGAGKGHRDLKNVESIESHIFYPFFISYCNGAALHD